MIPKPYEPPLHWHIKKTFLFLALLSGFFEPLKGQTNNIESFSSNDEKPFANPVLIYGTNFLQMFQVYYKQADWEMMISFTSRESIKRIGKKQLLTYYKRMKFGYSFRLYSMKKEKKQYLLNYNAKLNATDQIIRCIVRVENDTCRIMLPDSILHYKTFLFK